MYFQEILGKKRDRIKLTQAEIQYFIKGYTQYEIPDYQVSAFLMSVFLNGMDIDETTWLTDAMLHSGIVVDLSDIEGIKVDKHSTGGVGDKTSLIIAPICAALNVPVPMISGRGLAHSGGTLDKLESIPGFNVNLNLDQYRHLIRETGLCLIGQTAEIAPADKKIYALRDVTCTVENKSLISASIMSKKLAEGIDALVLDVKTGKGAFMKTQQDSEALAQILISIGKNMGKQVTALITDMDQPLGTHIGNALEIIESVDILKNKCLPLQDDLRILSIELAAHMIILGGKAKELSQAKSLVNQVIQNGSAFSKLKEIVSKQGGNDKALDDFSLLPQAKHSEYIKANADGFVKELDALKIGKGAVLIGGGRMTMDSKIDHGVGVIMKKKIGEPVKKGEPVLEILFNDPKTLKNAADYFNQSITISKKPVEPVKLIKKTLI
ncbi:MAG: thymidine phosphorylase [Deltaproteobacteria bacterium]|jgi:pyrimidine-nucleoside phosphorylase|nr:thymidine phosphorylase [Deltaproteobacteria bacterium]MBT4525173.1 thymidine phosphorylase [Deltaproteobacteria bacterium]